MLEPEVAELLRQHGIRITKSRALIIACVHKMDSPFSAYDIRDQMAEHDLGHVDLVTIYRNLNLLIQKGLLKSLSFSDDRTLYEVTWLRRKERYTFVSCRRCKKHQALTLIPHRFKREIRQSQLLGFKNLTYSLEFSGICPSCISTDSAAAGRPRVD